MNIYHVVYATSEGESSQVYVVASTQQNATDAAQAADSGFESVTSIGQIGGDNSSVIVAS